MVRFSYCLTPTYPAADAIKFIRKADELGFYAAYGIDEIYHKDTWMLFAVAAGQTEQIRLGPNVTHVILRDPTFVAQMLGTLDELSNGRAEAVVSFGNLGMLSQYGVQWKGSKPLSRVREGLDVIRTFLTDGAITHNGEFFNYSGLFTAARPVQERIPLKIGAMGGPKSFQLAGEISDGMHHALGYSRENYEYVMEHVRIGAEKAGRKVEDLDIGAWVITTCGEDSAQAKECARILVAFYLSSMPESQLNRHGISSSDLQPILDAFAAGQVDKAIELTSSELADALSISGTPAQCAEKLRNNILSTGVNHVIYAICDPFLVKAFSGRDVANVPDTTGQLQLLAERVNPTLN